MNEYKLKINKVERIKVSVTDPKDIDNILFNATFNDLCETATDIALLSNDAKDRTIHLDIMKSICSIEEVIAYIKKALKENNVPLMVEIG